ncbi:MAG: DUF4349 domain-containing protein [Rubrobacteraceae bacterium]
MSWVEYAVRLLVVGGVAALVLASCASADLPEPAEAPASGGMAESGGEFAAVEDEAVRSGEDAGGFDRRVIKTADLGITANNVRESASEAQRIAADFGGSTLSSQVSQGEEYLSANLVLSVPAPEFEEALDELRGLAEEVTTDAVRGEDVTEEFVDLESRERNLLAAEENLLGLYDEAESVEDSLAVGRELTRVRGEIERIQGRLQYLEQRTEFSQISLDIQPVAGAARSEWNPAGVVARSWSASLSVLQGLATALLSTVVFGWWLAPVVVLAVFLWRRWRSRRQNEPPAPAETG